MAVLDRAVETAAPAAASLDELDRPAGTSTPEGTGQPAGRWGEGLGYPDWFEAVGPAVHDMFNAMNRYAGVPALKMGLGRYMSTPFTGYLMILRTRGRKSGEMRDAPLGYVIQGDSIYCMAGFGRRTHWFQNLLADGRVEAILPDRAISGLADEVTDPEERAAAMRVLLPSMAPVVMATGLGNPWRESPDVMAERLSEFPIVRIRQTGIAAGPNDPGGLGWVVSVGTATVLSLWAMRAFGRGLRRVVRGPRR